MNAVSIASGRASRIVSPSSHRVWPLTLLLIVAGTLAAAVFTCAGRQRSSPRLNSRLRRLSELVVGLDRRAINTAIGPPAALAGRIGRLTRNETWYYPIDQKRKIAMAIQFAGGIAKSARILNWRA